MTRKLFLLHIILLSFLPQIFLYAQKGGKHDFEVRNSEPYLDRKPFQVISGEMAPARIPAEHWLQRIRMAKAVGVNTITAEIPWNYHEIKEGQFDFETENREIRKFLEIAEEQKVFVILKAPAFSGTGWENGGIPAYLLKNSNFNLSSPDASFIAAAGRYISELSKIIKPLQVSEGGPVLMIRIEDSDNPEYITRIRKIWAGNDIDIPVLTGKESVTDIPMLHDGNKKRCVHWGGNKIAVDTTAFMDSVRSSMKEGRSFNFVLCRGSNFGYMAGACTSEAVFEPDITAFDLDAPVSESGLPSPVFYSLRKLLNSDLPKGRKSEDMPDPVRVFEIPALSMQPFTSVWDNLPQPVSSDLPGTLEDFGQDYGFILYRTELKEANAGKLIAEVHDYATVFLNGQFIGIIDRCKGIKSIDIPSGSEPSGVLEILVEAMGRTAPEGNYTDRKGINGNVTLNGSALTGWKIYNLPLDWKFIYGLRSTGKNLRKPGIFFKGNFSLIDKADTYFDVSRYTKGIVWINGHNLGRFWNNGPQTRLYCPSSWIKTGMNEIIIFDIVQTEAKPFSSFETME